MRNRAMRRSLAWLLTAFGGEADNYVFAYTDRSSLRCCWSLFFNSRPQEKKILLNLHILFRIDRCEKLESEGKKLQFFW